MRLARKQMSLIYLPIRTQQGRCPLIAFAVLVILTSASSAARDPKAPERDVLVVADDLESRTSSGIKIHVVATDDFEKSALKQIDVVYLLDVKRLKQESLDAIRNHVRGGAGLCIFLGPRADRAFYRQLNTEEQQYLMPAPLAQVKSLAREKETTQPDIAFSKHPAFQKLLDAKTFDAFVGRVRIEKYHGVSEMWDVDRQQDTEVAIRLSNGDPLAISHDLGKGRSVVFVTSPDDQWHTWPVDVTWVVVMHETLSYLARKNTG